MIAIAEPKRSDLQTLDGRSLLQQAKAMRNNLPHVDWELLEKLLSEPIEYMDNPLFHGADSEQAILDSLEDPTAFDTPEVTQISYDFFAKPDHDAAAFTPLTADQETRLFTQMNYARYRIYQAVEGCGIFVPNPTLLEELVRWRKTELAIRNRIAQANIPLVLAMAKRSKLTIVEFSELISEGNMALLRSVDKFDTSRGFKFSTYACRAILKSFSRIAIKATTHRRRFPVAFDPDFERGNPLEQTRSELHINCLERIQCLLAGDDPQEILTPTEKRVLKARFDIGQTESEQTDERMTLEEVGMILGLSKERVRQIQNNGLRKLRDLLDEYVLNS